MPVAGKLRKIRNWNHSSLQIRDRRARSTRNFKFKIKISARAGATGGATSHRPDTWDMHMYAIRAFGFERSQSSKLKLAA